MFKNSLLKCGFIILYLAHLNFKMGMTYNFNLIIWYLIFLHWDSQEKHFYLGYEIEHIISYCSTI